MILRTTSWTEAFLWPSYAVSIVLGPEDSGQWNKIPTLIGLPTVLKYMHKNTYKPAPAIHAARIIYGVLPGPK